MGKVIGSALRGLGRLTAAILSPFGLDDEARQLFEFQAGLFDPQRLIRGKRLNDFNVNSGEAFDPLDEPFGPRARVRGVVAYIGPISAEKVSPTSGKGGGSTTQESYIYRADVAVDFGVAPDGGIVEFTSIWCDGQFVYGQNPNQNVTSDQLSATKVTAGGKIFLDIASTAAGPNLKKFKPSGSPVVMTGWATGGNNITAEVVSSKKNKSTGTSTMRVRVEAADAGGVATEAAGQTVTLLQENVKSNLNELADVELYLGTPTQGPDATLEANEGTGNSSGARGRLRIVVSQLALNRWGNRVPLSWEAVVQAHASLTLAQAVQKLCERAGLTSGQFDVTGLSGDVQGFVLRAGEAPAEALAALMVAYDVLATEDAGQLVFFHRSAAPHVSASSDDLGAHAPDEEPQRELRMDRTPEIALPSEVAVSFLDTTKDLQQGDARQQSASPTRQLTESYGLAVALDPEDARAIAKRLHWLPRAQRHTVAFNLPPSRQDVRPGDVIDVTAHGEAWQLIVQRVDTGANGVLAVEAVADNTGVVTLPTVGAADDDSDSLQVPPPTALEVMDLPAITDAHVLLPGVYFGVSLYDTEQPWPGATVHDSADAGATYNLAALAPAEAVMGYVSTGTLSVTASPVLWDRGSSVTVTVWNGELESVSELDALNLRNLAAVKTTTGWEVVVFRTATLTGTTAQGYKQYALSLFLRGVRGTEDQISAQQSGAAFVLLDPAQFQQYALGDQNKERRWRAIPDGGATSDFSEYVEGTLGLRTLKPFAPTLVSFNPPQPFIPNAITDIVLTWARRTRAFVDPFVNVGGDPDDDDNAQLTLAEESDVYDVEVYVGLGYSELVRTVTVNGSGGVNTSWTYTGAMQSADDVGVNELHVGFRVYQRSTSVGRGIPLLAVLS